MIDAEITQSRIELVGVADGTYEEGIGLSAPE
jgi:hypothetical protein